jgi:hypothetical protein
MSSQRTTQILASLLGATLGPILVVSSYLYYSRTHLPINDTSGDLGALGAAVLVGAICIYFLGRLLGWFRRGAWVGVLVVAVYSCAAAGFLFMYTFGFVCGIFGSCL